MEAVIPQALQPRVRAGVIAQRQPFSIIEVEVVQYQTLRSPLPQLYTDALFSKERAPLRPRRSDKELVMQKGPAIH